MKKSLIALAVAGAFAAPVAMADVKIGGEMDVNFESFNNGSKSGLQGNDTHSRWWIDSADDIGGGAKIVAHFEVDQGVSQARGMNNRDSFLGIKGDFGMVKVGTEEGIYEQLGYQMDPYHGAAGNAGNIVNGLGQYGGAVAGAHGGTAGNAVCGGNNMGCRRLSNTLSYVSNDLSGFNFKIDYTGGGPASSAPGLDSAPSTIQYGGYYAGNASGTGFRLALGGIQVKNTGLIGTAGESESDTGMRVTGGVTFGDFSIDALMEQNKWKNDASGIEIKANHLNLAATYTMPTGKLVADYMKLGKTKVNGADMADTDGSHYGVGYYHNLSKSSSLYVIYSKLTNKDQAQFNLQDGATAAVGKSPSSIGVGAYYVF